MWFPDNSALPDWVSYSRIDDEFWIIDHRNDSLLKLNSAASAIFAKLITGVCLDEVETRFVQEQLASVITFAGDQIKGKLATAADPSDPYGAFRYLRELALYKCTPLFATLELTYRCNLDCCHCYRPHEPSETMPLARWKSLVAELKQIGTLSLALTGGEPLAWPHFRELVTAVRALRMAFLVKTNGWLLDDSLCEFLAQHYVTEVHVSMYGGAPSSHDAVTRCPGSFKRARRAIKRCAAAGIPVQISCILTRSTWREYEAVARIADELEVGVGFNPVIMPSAEGAVDYEALRLTPEQIRHFCHLCIGDSPLLKVLRFPGHPVCSAARSNCSIAPDGRVYPCNGYWYATSTESVLERPFDEVWRSSPILKQVRDLTNADLAQCSACTHFAFCPRCPGMGHAETGEVAGIAPGDCLYARAFHRGHQEQPPAVLFAQAGSFGSRCQ